MVAHRDLLAHVRNRKGDHVTVLEDRTDLHNLVLRLLFLSGFLIESKDDLQLGAFNEIFTVKVHFVALTLSSGLNFFSLFNCPLSLLLIAFLFFFLCDFLRKGFFGLLCQPFGDSLFFFNQSFAKVVNIGKTIKLKVVIRELKRINPLLVIQRERDIDDVGDQVLFL